MVRREDDPPDQPGTVAKGWFAAPIRIALVWWSVCLAMFVAGWPIPYVRTNLLLVLLLIAACAAMLALGFHIAARRSPTPLPTRSRIPVPVAIGVLCTLALVGPVSTAYSGFGLHELGAALANQGAAFEQGTQRILEGSDSRTGLLLVQTILAPLTLVALPCVAFYWFEHRRGGLLFIAALAAPIVTSILVGRDQQLGWSVVLVGTAWLISRARRGLRVRVWAVVVLAIAAVAFALAFAARKLSRSIPGPLCPPGAKGCLFESAPPGPIEAAVAYVAGYASQGFEGLGRAFYTDWAFGGGFAHAPALNDLLIRYLGIDRTPTVSTQLTSVGWSDTWYWSTALPNLANDIPWLLIPFVFLAEGALLASSWRRSLRTGDWLSVGVFSLTFLGVLFTPQNLQLAASGPAYVGYLVLLALYLGRSGAELASRADHPAHSRSASSFATTRSVRNSDS